MNGQVHKDLYHKAETDTYNEKNGKQADHFCLNYSENDFTEGTTEQEQMDCQDSKYAEIETGMGTEIRKGREWTENIK